MYYLFLFLVIACVIYNDVNKIKNKILKLIIRNAKCQSVQFLCYLLAHGSNRSSFCNYMLYIIAGGPT